LSDFGLAMPDPIYKILNCVNIEIANHACRTLWWWSDDYRPSYFTFGPFTANPRLYLKSP